VSSVSNGLYFLTLPLVSVMRVIYRKIRHARYLYIKRNVEKVWGARYTLGARYLSKNMVIDSTACVFFKFQIKITFFKCPILNYTIKALTQCSSYTPKNCNRKGNNLIWNIFPYIQFQTRFINLCSLKYKA